MGVARVSFWAGELACLLLAAGCGGKAVMDGTAPGAGGAVGAGGETGTTSSTCSTSGCSTSGTSTNTTTSSSTDPPESLCQQACVLLASCEVQPSCPSRCQATAPECGLEHQAWLECLLANLAPEGCVPALECHAPFDEWRFCGLTWHSISVTVNGEDGSCHSSSQIDGGAGQIYEVDCAWGDGGFGCACTVDGQPAGKCLENMSYPSGACDPMEGCCASLFYVPFGPPSSP